jgi:hypothetical protein
MRGLIDPREMDGSTNNVPGTGVGIDVDVGKVVGDGITVEATEAVWLTIGVGTVPHPARNKDIKVMIVKVRSISISKTLCNFIPPISK